MENSVWRKMFSWCYITRQSLRGEVGLIYLWGGRHQKKVELGKLCGTQEIWPSTQRFSDYDWKTVNTYESERYSQFKNINLSFEKLIMLIKRKVKNEVHIYSQGTEKWKSIMREKSTLKVHGIFNNEIKQEHNYDNSQGSELLFKTRPNSVVS